MNQCLQVWAGVKATFCIRELSLDTLHELSNQLTLFAASSYMKPRRDAVMVLSGRYQVMALMVMLHYVQEWAFAPPVDSGVPLRSHTQPPVPPLFVSQNVPIMQFCCSICIRRCVPFVGGEPKAPGHWATTQLPDDALGS